MSNPGKLLSSRNIPPQKPFFEQKGPLSSRKFYGRNGQTALQIGASVGLLLTFVLIPSIRNYVRDWQKKEYE
ncbi:hypothetical protein TeGR_g8284 [Tetraparma gracilis]|uniref:Uncharacterized protein n=1 Tax=Tetraparma gracilis TaxID=2962635 RepID=A0ABQ6NAK4_9STRA|nr:hypothetical protein TeGR_g8284 [Tetraparma gracilis]